MKTILVPLDFSKKSEFAVLLASHISRRSECEVHLLHMVELPTGIIDMGAGSNFSIPESMMYLRKVKEKIVNLKRTFFEDDTHIKHGIRFQNPHEGIIEYSTKIGASLIIMGAKGVSDFEEMLIGSNTEKVVRTSKIPVIVVKKEIDDFKLKDIVFASNFNDENKESFAKLLNFSEEFNSNIHLLKINTPDKFESSAVSKEKIKDFLNDFEAGNSTINVYNDISVVKGIMNFSKEINADLIALSTHGRSGLSHLFNGSVSKNLSRNSLRPLITFKI